MTHQTGSGGESLQARDGSGSSIIKSGNLLESLQAAGTYHVTCTGPVEEFREDAARLHALIAIEKARRLPRYDSARRYQRVLEKQLECIPTEEKWRDTIHNVVTTVGKNHMLDNYLAGSSFTQVGPYLGLISSVGYAAGPVAGDTMSSHTGWAEAGNGTNYPLWSTPASNARATAAWSAASAGAKALSAALQFTIATTGGTVKGAFLVLGSGAVATNNSTAGTLFSAGTFTGGDKIVSPPDILSVSWSLAI